MDKSILLLIASGVIVAVLHMPTVVITFGIIAALVMASIKVCWTIVQSFSQPVEPRRPLPVRNY
ncbi:MAG: hypothetical protein WA885_15810 [Phormidesmis sp.]